MFTRQLLSLLLPLLLMFSGNVFGADIHQWRDANGNLHFGDKPPANAQSQQLEVKPNIYVAPVSSGPPVSVAKSKPAVTLYSTTWCGYCKKARAYFIETNVAFKEYDVETSRKGVRDYERFGASGVPVILVGKQRLQGFNRAAFDRAYAKN